MAGELYAMQNIVNPDTVIGVLTPTVVVVLAVHPVGWLVMHRFLVGHAFMPLVRGVLIFITTLPSPNPMCWGRTVRPGWPRAAERALSLSLASLGVNPQWLVLQWGYDITCCDFIILGYMSVLMVDAMVCARAAPDASDTRCLLTAGITWTAISIMTVDRH